MQRSSCAGTTALVTGASHRIGRSIALACAREGMNVVVHYHKSKKDAITLVREIETFKKSAWPLCCDLENPGACEALIAKAQSLCGNTLSLLVNNAATFPEQTLAGVTLRDITGNVRVNAWAPLCLSRTFATAARRGSIVNVLDARIAGRDRNHAAYMLSKHMLASLTRMCALEFAPRVRVNAVAPGLILPPAGKTMAYVERLAKKVPLGARGTPDDVAAAVLFLAKSPFVTGQTIFVDGGRHLLAYDSAM
jgi:pteridine reductase